MDRKHLENSRSSLDEDCRHRRLEEVYVLAEVGWLKREPHVKKAIEERGLQIHPFVYDKDKNTCFRLVERE
jgi:carbonic anhydrase